MKKELTPEERTKIYKEIFDEAGNLVRRQMYRFVPFADEVEIGKSMRKLRDLLAKVV